MSVRNLLDGLLNAVHIDSPTGFRWYDEASPTLSSHLRALLTPQAARRLLVGSLRDQLYDGFYLPGLAVPRRSHQRWAWMSRDPAFVDELSSANAGAGPLQEGVLVGEEADGTVVVHVDGLQLWLNPDQVSRVGDEGAIVQLRLPAGLPSRAPGFYAVLGNLSPGTAEPGGIVRVYWNLTASGAALFVSLVTECLNREGVPFWLKVVNHPDRFDRCDAGVLYVPAATWGDYAPLLGHTYQQLRSHLKAGVPSLTKPVAPGLGVAEDPPGDESFGQHRCRLLADALVDAYERAATSSAERLDAIEQCFEREGLSLDVPFLNPGSVDRYELCPTSAAGPQTTATRPRPNDDPDAFVKVASALAKQIGEDAICCEEHCNWLAPEPADPDLPEPPVVASLGPDLYGGTAGIALFLAECYRLTGDELTRTAALGAMRQALGRSASDTSRVQRGLYTGWSGVAVAAGWIGMLLSEDSLLDGARCLTQRLVDQAERSAEHDLLSGAAGEIVALLLLSELLNDDAPLGVAVRHGERLIEAAQADGAGWSWPALGGFARRNLTGFSHGAAGIGYALLDLWNVTRTPDFRFAAERAFAFERHWFDPERGNWPDFRKIRSRARRPRGPFPYPAFWCHGAPGIALSRLRAWELTGDPVYRSEAIAALNTTQGAVHQALESGALGFSLCHGLCGCAEILLLGQEHLGAEFEHYRVTALRAAQAGIALHAAYDHTWPADVPGGETPSLMLGLAGIGRFYLRLHAPELAPSVLLPSEFAADRSRVSLRSTA